MLRRPLLASIALTNQCNLQCIHCLPQSGDPLQNELTTHEVLGLIDDLAEMGVMIVAYTGGEPFLRKDFFEILSYTKMKGLKSTITTNGTLINYEVARKLRDLEVMLMRVSIDSAQEDSHDWFRGVHGSFRLTTNAIRILSKVGLPVTVLTTVSSFNVDEIENIIDLSIELGAKGFNTSLFIPYGKGEAHKNLQLRPDQYKDMLQVLRSKREHLKGKIDIKAEDPLSFLLETEQCEDPYCYPRMCQAAISTLEITADGFVMPCLSFDIKEENVRRRPIQEIWSKSNLFRKVRDRSLLEGKCKDCKFLKVCSGGCRAMAYISSENLFAPDPMCWYQP